MDVFQASHVLVRKEPANLYDVVQPALEDPGLRDQLVAGSFAKDETYRYNCVRVLLRAMDQRAALFYPYWERFEKMLDSPNGFHRSAAAQAIAYLSNVDEDCRLDSIFRHYLRLLDDSKVMVSHYFLETLPIVYQARGDLRTVIVKTLLGIDKTGHPPARKELLKADVINFFDRLYSILPPEDRKKALVFVRRQMDSQSSKTRKASKEFLKRHHEE